MNILKIREDFPALKNYVWFQNGGVSITPRPIAQEHIRLMQELLQRGPIHIVYPDEEYPRRQQTMARLARFFSVKPEELALMRGVSEGYQTVLRGLSWQAGDQLMITEDEEAALLLPALHLRDRFGVEVVKLPLVADEKGQLEAFSKRLTERTRLVALSHVGTDFGYRIPARPICDLARERGVPTFLDLAHSAGLYPMSVAELGCDFAGLLSYKWMYAPYAAGLLYVREERLYDLQVTYAGGRSEKSLDFDNDRYELSDTCQRFEYGPWSWPLIHAWAYAAGYLDRIGLDNIWSRTEALTNRLKQGLKEIPGCTLLTPEAPEFSAALVTFSIEGCDSQTLCEVLRRRWNIIIKKPIPASINGLRASMPFFLLEAEIDLLLEALKIVAAEQRGRV